MAQSQSHEVIFRECELSEMQVELYRAPRKREIESIRYADEPCLIALGILDSVNHMLNTLSLNYLLSFKDHVYVHLTLEFLSSLIFNPTPTQDVPVGLFNFSYSM